MSVSEVQASTSFPKSRYPSLWRIANAPPTGYFLINYRLSQKAAAIIEKHPEILLHFRLYGIKFNKPYVCQIGEEKLLVKSEKNEVEKSAPVYNITIVTAEDAEVEKGNVECNISGLWRAPLLPFDIDRIRFALQQEQMGQGTWGVNHALNYTADPFDVYRAMHEYVGQAAAHGIHFAEIREVLEVGSGLGAISLIVSQFLPEANILGVDIDSGLLVSAARLKSQLERDNKYTFPKVKMRRANVFDLRAEEVAKVDLLTGWFPLADNIPDSTMITLFQRLRRGALVLQLENYPLPPDRDNEANGFQKLNTALAPFHIFRRI